MVLLVSCHAVVVSSSAALNSQAVLHKGHRLSLCDESHLLMHCRWKACEHTPKHTGDSSPGYRQSGAACSKEFRQIPQQSSFSPAFHVLGFGDRTSAGQVKACVDAGSGLRDPMERMPVDARI